MRSLGFSILKMQILLVLFASPFVLWFFGWRGFSALWFGGIVAMFNIILMSRRLAAANLDVERGLDGSMQLYLGAVERFAFAALGFALGMGYLKLSPLPLLAGFGLAQLVYFWGGRVGFTRDDAPPVKDAPLDKVAS